MRFINKKNGKLLLNTRLDTTLIYGLKKDNDIKKEKCYTFHYDISDETIFYKQLESEDIFFDIGVISISKDNMLTIGACLLTKEAEEIDVKILLNYYEIEKLLCYIINKQNTLK